MRSTDTIIFITVHVDGDRAVDPSNSDIERQPALGSVSRHNASRPNGPGIQASHREQPAIRRPRAHWAARSAEIAAAAVAVGSWRHPPNAGTKALGVFY